MATVYWSLNNDGRLFIEDKTPEYLAYDYENKNLSDWYLNNRDVITADLYLHLSAGSSLILSVHGTWEMIPYSPPVVFLLR